VPTDSVIPGLVCVAGMLNFCALYIQSGGEMIDQDAKQRSDEDASFASGVAAFETRDFAKALRFLSPLADQGEAEAQHRCAIMWQNGLGIVANAQKAAELMRAAAEQGHALAQHGLGFMYMEGECVEQNGEEAVKWFKKAADQGLVGSMTTLAMLYEQGNIVEKNPEEAKRLYKLAGF
jgi:hypothetical protein